MTERRRQSLLSQFKNFNADALGVDELVALSAFGTNLKAEYQKLKMEVPEFVEVQGRAIRRLIRNKVTDKVQSQLKEAKLQLESLKTPTEKKSELKNKIADLEEQLAEVG
jgi:hypothetical protein